MAIQEFFGIDVHMHEPWPHMVSVIKGDINDPIVDPTKNVMDPLEEIYTDMSQLTNTVNPTINTARGLARKLQHITNLDGTPCDTAIDEEAFAYKDYSDPGKLWKMWKYMFGRSIEVKYFHTLRPHAYARMKNDDFKNGKYAVKMTYWKDTLVSTTDDGKLRPSIPLSIARDHTILRSMVFITPEHHEIGEHYIVLDNYVESEPPLRYRLKRGLQLTYNPKNPNHLIRFENSIADKYADKSSVLPTYQNTWVMFEIIKNDIGDS